MKLLLDTNILARLCHPVKEENHLVGEWLTELLDSSSFTIYIPEIADYEARRGLLHVALRSGRSTTRSLDRLDRLGELLNYLPLTTQAMRRAALLWAESRNAGRPTAAGEALDGDVILAAQALEVSGVVITENVRHLSRLVTTYRWQNVTTES